MILPLIVALGIAGSPIAPLGQTGSSGRLAALLKDWEKAESQVKDVRKVIRRTYFDRVWQTEEVAQLVVLGKKPTSFRVEESDAKGKPCLLLINSKSMFGTFDFRAKTQTIFGRYYSSNTPLDTQIAASLNLWFKRFCLGFDVSQFAKDYDLTLAGEDEFYAYLAVKPRKSSTEIPKRSWLQSLFEFKFQIMQIALRKSDFQPREIRWTEPDGNSFRYECLEIKTNLNPPVTEEMIEADFPKGWVKTRYQPGEY